MRQGRREKIVAALAAVTVLVSATGAVYGLVERIQLLFYPSLAVLFGSVTYLGARVAGRVEYDEVLELLPSPRVLQTLISVGIVALVVLSRTNTVGVGVPFYWTVPVVVLLFVATILQRPSRITLGQVVLFAVAMRAAIWFSAPTVGVDTKVHLAITQYIIESGTLPPSEVTYYHWYPLAHVVAGITSKLSPASPKQAVFLTQGLYACVGLFVVYLLTTWMTDDVLEPNDRARAALFAVLVVAVAPWHLRRTSVLIAQSLGLATVPFVLYTALRFRERAYAALAVGFAALIVFAHNLTPLVLTFVLFTLLVTQRLTGVVRRWDPDWQSFAVGYGYPLVFAVGVLTVQYWIFIRYFDLQVYRILYLFSTEASLSENAAKSTLSIANAFTLADPFIHIGIEQLVFGPMLLLLGFFILRGRDIGLSGERWETGLGRIRRREWRSDGGRRDADGGRADDGPLPMGLFLGASGVFAVLSLAILVGWGANVIRAVPNVVLIVAPAFGFLFVRSYRSQSLVAIVVVALLVALPVSLALAATVGTVNPGLAPTDIRPNHNYLTAPEKAVTEFVLRRGSPSATYFGAGYVAAATNYRAAGRQAEASPPREAFIQTPLMNVRQRVWGLGYTGPDSHDKTLAEIRAEPEQYFVHVPGFEPSLDRVPRSCSVVYDSGSAKVVGC